jgi:hypothetical protein
MQWCQHVFSQNTKLHTKKHTRMYRSSNSMLYFLSMELTSATFTVLIKGPQQWQTTHEDTLIYLQGNKRNRKNDLQCIFSRKNVMNKTFLLIKKWINWAPSYGKHVHIRIFKYQWKEYLLTKIIFIYGMASWYHKCKKVKLSLYLTT